MQGYGMVVSETHRTPGLVHCCVTDRIHRLPGRGLDQGSGPPAASAQSLVSFSPMQRIGVMPCLSAALTFLLTSSSVSAWYSRRSEWPTVTKLQPSFASITPEMSPV